MDELENKARIAELKAIPPVVLGRSRKQKYLSWARDTAAVIALLAFALGLYTYHRSATQARQTSVCVNKVLGGRNDPALKDAAAHYDWAVAIDKLLSLPSKATVAVREAAVADFRAATAKYKATLAADQADRAAHPLGQC